jgi:hypothetical protein
MAKWFKRSLMALGALFILFIPIAIFAQSAETELFDNLGIALVLLAFALCLSAFATGIGALVQKLTRSNLEKAKRDFVYEDAMLNRIMSRLDDEERTYLQDYLNAHLHKPTQEFFYLTEENQDYNNK